MTTVRIHDSALRALRDAEARPMKSIFHNAKMRAYAVGDWTDLPIYNAAGAVLPGFWKEITLRELAQDADELPPHADASVRWDLEPEGTDR
jgi:hypothetical protein